MPEIEPSKPVVPGPSDLTASIRSLLEAVRVDPRMESHTEMPPYLSVHSGMVAGPDSTPTRPAGDRDPATHSGGTVDDLPLPADPLARVSLMSAVFLEGLNYTELSSAVSIIVPEPEPEPDEEEEDASDSNGRNRPVRKPAGRLPRDLTPALLAAGVRRVRSSAGQAVMQLADPARGPGLRERFLQEEFGLVHHGFESLMGSDLALSGSVAFRHGLAAWGGLLAREDAAFGRSLLGRLFQRLEEEKAELAHEDVRTTRRFWQRVAAGAEMLSIWWSRFDQAAVVLETLAELIVADSAELLLGLLEGLKPLGPGEHARWLARVASGCGVEGQRLVESELWWRLSQDPRRHPEHWQALKEWALNADRKHPNLVAWARPLLRRLLVRYGVGDSRQVMTRQVLLAAVEAGVGTGSSGRTRAAEIVFGNATYSFASRLALAVATDAFSGDTKAGAPDGPVPWEDLFRKGGALDHGLFAPTESEPDPMIDLRTPAGIALVAEVHFRHPSANAGLIAWIEGGPFGSHLKSPTARRFATDLCREYERLGQALARLKLAIKSETDAAPLERACIALRSRFKAAVALRTSLVALISPVRTPPLQHRVLP